MHCQTKSRIRFASTSACALKWERTNMKKKVSPSAERHDWLEAVVEALRTKFKDAGYTIPDEIRVSIGWPKRGGGCGKRIGECWSLDASSDKHAEIFVSPEL